MIVVDTSAWVEFLRDAGSPVAGMVERLLDDEIAICDAIAMEVLAGARDERHLADLRGLLARAVVLPTSPADYDLASSLYRSCRSRGVTVGRLIDCLIAAVSIGAGAAVLHADADYDVLAEHTALRVVSRTS